MDRFTIQELIAEAQRELGMRKSVYKKRIAAGVMTQEGADLAIAKMEAIAEILGKTKPTKYAVMPDIITQRLFPE